MIDKAFFNKNHIKIHLDWDCPIKYSIVMHDELASIVNANHSNKT